MVPLWARGTVAPVRERGLKFGGIACGAPIEAVAPVRERGLKSEVAQMKRKPT